MKKTDLSFIIPVFNEEMKILNDIMDIEEFVKSNTLNIEVIISNDGSTDNTEKIIKENASRFNFPITILNRKGHVGKGHAIRKGVLESKGEFIILLDSGSCISLEYIIPEIDNIEKGICDISFASRRLKDSMIKTPYSFVRNLYSRIFYFFIIICFPSLSGLSDTQCGFKILRGRDARSLFSYSRLNGFLFDIELSQQAVESNLIIKEFPVIWQNDSDSRLYLRKNFRQILAEFLHLFFSRFFVKRNTIRLKHQCL